MYTCLTPLSAFLLVSYAALALPTPMLSSKMDLQTSHPSASSSSSTQTASRNEPPLRVFGPPTDGNYKSKGAIHFMDAKADDVSQHHLIRNDGYYSHNHVVLSGVNNVRAAHGHVLDHQNFMEEQGNYPNAAKTTFYAGDNPLGSAAPHEKSFHGTPTPVANAFSKEILQNNIKSEPYSEVDIWHHAPTNIGNLEATVQAIKGSGKRLNLFHTTVGYNSLQGKEGDAAGHAAEMQGVKNLEKMVTKHFPNARVSMLQSTKAFKKHGGTQPMEWAQGRFPPQHLDDSGKNEHFHGFYLREADKLVKEYYPDGHKDVKPLPTNDKQLFSETWAAREKGDDASRKLAKVYADHAQSRYNVLKGHLKGTKYEAHPPRLQVIKGAFENPCETLFCDANHYAAVQEAHNHNPGAFVRATVKGEVRPNIEPAKAGDQEYGWTLVDQDADNLRKGFEHLFPILPKNGGKGSA